MFMVFQFLIHLERIPRIMFFPYKLPWMVREVIYFSANGVVAVYIESLVNRFLSFQYVHGVGPFPVYRNHVATPPSDDYEHLNKQSKTQKKSKVKK